MSVRVTVMMVGALLLAGCGGASRPILRIDAVREACVEACQIDNTHHCHAWTFKDSSGGKLSAQDYCSQLCQQKANEAEKQYRPGCGVCLARGTDYVTKPEPYCNTGKPEVTCCWGVAVGRTPGTPVCVPACFGADGGAAD